MSEFDWPTTIPARLRDQIAFLSAVNDLKEIYRASLVHSGGRKENSAEHSWHVMLFAEVLSEYSDEPIDKNRVVNMLMIHDIVEIDAGDMPLHGAQDPLQAEREQQAADRLFSLLPDDQAKTLRNLWDEFEGAESADARFAKALDRLQPVLQNAMTHGGTWQEFDVCLSQLKEKTAAMSKGSTMLWDVANDVYDVAVTKGWVRSN